MKIERIPVVIIGSGPVGLSMALALARQGIAARILERNSQTTEHPKARGVSMRTMELFRQWGNAEELLSYEQPKEARRFIWVESLQGKEITRIIRNDEELHSCGPLLASFVSQDKVELSLYHAVQNNRNASVQFSKKMLDFTQDDTGVTLRVINCITQQEELLHADYMIAADGANSHTRQQLNIEMEGPADLGRYCNVYCDMDILEWTKHRHSLAFMFADPALTGRFLASVDGVNRWIVGMRFAANQTKEDFTEEYCLSEIKRITRIPDLDIKIVAKNFWTMGAQIASSYRKGRVFLVGDAAHRLPPTGGLGMNTGIQDAHNLAWKLTYVLKGYAHDALLDTYYDERNIIAKQNMAWSAENAKRHGDIAKAIIAGDAESLKIKLHEQQNNLNYAGLDLGFIYHSKAILSENNQRLSISEAEYVPTTLPGSRAPHVWLFKNDIKISTLDLFENEFVLLIAANGLAWKKAAETLINNGLDYPLKIYQIAIDGDLIDPENNWQKIYEIDDSDAVLVRPDGHVAWRCKSETGDELAVLTQVFRKCNPS